MCVLAISRKLLQKTSLFYLQTYYRFTAGLLQAYYRLTTGLPGTTRQYVSNMSLNVSRRGGFENFSFTDNFQSIIVPLFTTIKTCALLNLSCDDIIINRMTLY